MAAGIKGPLRWGFFGAGNITSDFVTVLSTLPQTKHIPFGVASRDSQKAKLFAQSHGIRKSFDSYQLLAENPDIDIVYIGSVNSEHYSQAKLVIEHSKHVLIEKPICVNYKQCKDLTDSAKKKGVFLMEGFWTNMFPAAQRLFTEVKNGSIGDVVSMTLDVGREGASTRDRFRLLELCGGILMNHGIYGIMLTCLLLGKPDNVTATAILSKGGIDETMTITMSYKDKRCISNVIMTSLATLPCELLVAGTKGIAKLPFPFWAPDKCILPEGTFDYELPQPESLQSAQFNYPFATGFIYEIDEVYRCISQGLLESPTMPWDLSLETLKIADDVRRQIGVVFPSD